MIDIVDKQTRSRMMSGIQSRDTQPEIAVRKALFAAGYRYRLHVQSMPGRPDIVIRRLSTVILVHGCFWHRHRNCKFAYTPRSNLPFWEKKFAQNITRDKYVHKELRRTGWQVRVIWECQVNERGLARLLRHIASAI